MKALISGITGSLGTEVAKLLLSKGWDVIGFSRDENKQGKIAPHDKLTLYLGDVRDEKRLLEASRGVDFIFHFAALKHVEKVELNPEEGIATNVIGTMNVLHAQRINKISRVVLSATDKGAYPVNVYGATKLLSERLVLRNSKNVVCRYGNVLASRGSVIEKFVKTLMTDATVEITDPNMTRFWLTIEEAGKFVVEKALDKAGGLKIPDMRAAKVSDIAEAVVKILNVKSYQIKMVGVRPGEKTHECLRTDYEGEALYSSTVREYSQEELIETLTPIVNGLL